MRPDRRYALTVTTPIIRTRVLHTGTTDPAILLMAPSLVLDPGITGDIQRGSGIVATTAAPMSATTGIMTAGLDGDGTTTGMRIGVGPAEAMSITTPAMDSAVGKPSTVEASPTVATVSMVDAAKR